MKRLSLIFSLALAMLCGLGTLRGAMATDRFVATTGIDVGNCSNSGSPCQTIGFAIGQSVAGDTIHVASGTYNNEDNIPINQDLTIDGAGQTATIVDAGGAANPVFFINTGTVTISHLTIQNANSDSVCGGGIQNNDTLTLQNVTVRDNSTSIAEGGGICNFGGMTIQDSIVGGTNPSTDGNHSIASNGGGIYNRGTLTINNSLIIGNSTEIQSSCGGNGGGIYNDFDSTLTINNSSVSNNTANFGGLCGFFGEGNGGGIFIATSTVVIDHSLIDGNQAMTGAAAVAVGGGGIYNGGGDLSIQDGSTISNNLAIVGPPSAGPTNGSQGGGIYHTSTPGGCDGPCPVDPNLTISNSTISTNQAFFDGGGIYRDNPMTLTNVTISGNHALNGEGGGVYNNGGIVTGCQLQSCPGTLIHVTIADNQADTVGGISADNTIIPTVLKNTLLAQNTQTSDGTSSNCNPADTALSSLNHNLSDDNTCDNFFTQAQDLKNQPAGIGPLANNGGNYPNNPPFTHALLLGSVAIDAVPPADCTDINGATLTVDERKFPRPGIGFGPNCDIGAFELQALPTPSPTPIPTSPPFFLEGDGISCSLNPNASPMSWVVLASFLGAPLLLRSLLRKKSL
jgi:hypothetical protein